MSTVKPILLLLLTVVSTLAQTVADSQRQAVEKYPKLATSGSELHTRFLAAVQERKKANPKFFEPSDWPLRLADELSAPIISGLTPGGEVTPSAATGRVLGSITVEGKQVFPLGHIQAMLVPTDTKFKSKLSLPAELEIRLLKNEPDKHRCFYARGDSAGRVTIPNVPPGEYFLTAITSEINTTKSGAQLSRFVLSRYLTAEGLDLLSNYRVLQVEVIVAPNETKEVSVHFP